MLFLFYHLRPIYSYLIRIAHFTHNYTAYSDYYDRFAAEISKIESLESSSTYYTVDNSQIYCVPKNFEPDFVDYLNQTLQPAPEAENTDNISRFQDKTAHYCSNHTDDCNGVCVVKILPIIADHESYDYPLYLDKFKSFVDLNLHSSIDFKAKTIIVHSYTSSAIFPHFRMCSDISEDLQEVLSVFEIVKSRISDDLNELRLITNHLEVWFGNEDKELTFDFQPIKFSLKKIIISPHGSFQSLAFLSKKCLKNAKKMVLPLREQTIPVLRFLYPNLHGSPDYTQFLESSDQLFQLLNVGPLPIFDELPFLPPQFLR